MLNTSLIKLKYSSLMLSINQVINHDPLDCAILKFIKYEKILLHNMVSFIGGENRRIRRKPPNCASHCQTLSHNVEYLVFLLSRIRTHNISGDRHILHRFFSFFPHQFIIINSQTYCMRLP
jgi:hypothetical protein